MVDAFQLLREEMAVADYLCRVNFAFKLMALYEMYPDRVDEIDEHWQYYCGRLVMGF